MCRGVQGAPRVVHFGRCVAGRHCGRGGWGIREPPTPVAPPDRGGDRPRHVQVDGDAPVGAAREADPGHDAHGDAIRALPRDVRTREVDGGADTSLHAGGERGDVLVLQRLVLLRRRLGPRNCALQADNGGVVYTLRASLRSPVQSPSRWKPPAAHVQTGNAMKRSGGKVGAHRQQETRSRPRT